ncbi:cation:proton antiporter [Porticoccus sp.]
MNDLVIILASVGLLSIGCQYLAYRIKIPAILPLLICGLLVGPVTGILNPDEVFGDLFFPIVSLAVAVILFDGALTLKFEDLAGHGSMVRNLCTIGALTTWLSITPVAHYALGIPWSLAFLFGAITTVTGPTVIVPMLRSVRPTFKISNILRWEGIVIDPIGALLAVLVYEFIVASQHAFAHTVMAFGLSVGVGLGIGLSTGYSLGIMIKKNWVPHYLLNTAVLTLMLAAYAFSNELAHESGLLAVTVMGICMANMKDVDVDDILEFKETLSVLLISALFILLAAKLDYHAITSLGHGIFWVLLAVILIARPLSVLLSSINTGLNWKEIALLSWIAPRGIVAAAVSALFAFKLEIIGHEQAALLVPLVFSVIIFTVVLQSLTAVHVARFLGLRSPKPNGILIFGAGKFSRLLAKELISKEIPVIIADTNWDAIREARMDSIPTYYGNPISEHAKRTLELAIVGKVLVISPYRQLNPLIMYHFVYDLGKDNVLGLPSGEQESRESHKLSEEYAKKLCLFSDKASYSRLASLVAKGAVIKTTKLSDSFTLEEYEKTYKDRAYRLFAMDPLGKLFIYTGSSTFKPSAGWQIISLVVSENGDTEVIPGAEAVRESPAH